MGGASKRLALVVRNVYFYFWIAVVLGHTEVCTRQASLHEHDDWLWANHVDAKLLLSDRGPCQLQIWGGEGLCIIGRWVIIRKVKR